MAQRYSQTATIVCPNCGHQFATPLYSLIDVGQDPQAKNQFLQGQINVAICPRCGTTGTLNTPFLYHDPQKELLFAYTPPPTAMSNDQQQRFIGSMINTVMSSLPTEKRKGYLFQPRTFLSLETMRDEIIIADGVSRQELESQKRKLTLLDRLRGATSDDVIEIIAQENEQELDYEFFLLLNNLIEHMKAQGNKAETEHLQTLHRKLLQYSATARQAEAQSTQMPSKEELLQRFLETDDEQQQKSLVAAARPLLDYEFFQTLTGLIEEAEQAGDHSKANQLADLRSKLLAWTDELDTVARQIWERKAKLIQEILQSPDWQAALESQWQEIDPIFLTILANNIQLSQQQNNSQAATTLQQLLDLALLVARKHVPPEVQLLNQLFEADYPAGTQRILEENRDLVNDNFLKLIDQVANDLTAPDQQQDLDTLQQIRTQVAEMITR